MICSVTPNDVGLEAENRLEAALGDGDLRSAIRLVCSELTSLVADGRATTALGFVDRLLGLVDPDRNPGQTGRLLAARASVLRTLRRYEDALEAETRAIACLADRAPEGVMTTLRHDRSVLLAELGYADEAVTGLVAAREAFLGARDRVGVAASDHNLSFVLHDLGALDDAIEYLTEARDIFLAIEMFEEAASCDQNLGVVFYDLGRLADAGRRFAVAHRRFTDNEAWTSAGECDANLSTLLTTMGQTDEAERYRQRAEKAGVGIPLVPGASSQTPAVVAEPLRESDHEVGSLGSASA